MYSLIPDKQSIAPAASRLAKQSGGSIVPAASKSADRKLINIGCSTILVVSLLVVVTLAAFGYALPGVGAVGAAGGMSHTYICLTAQDFVKRQLKAPSTAEFAPCSEPDTIVVESSGHKWTVTSYVDAQNGFGAMLRNDYQVTMVYYVNIDTWSLLDTKMASR